MTVPLRECGGRAPATGRAVRSAVVLAGGLGTRLAPYTSVLPKPLMPIGDKPILEIVMRQLGEHGIDHVALCVGHLSHLIRAVLDQLELPLDVDYVHEAEPLGTAGPLRHVACDGEPFLVMNGDVLTTIDYQDLAAAHHRAGNVVTVAARRRTIPIDYGVLELDGRDSEATRRIVAWSEKPELVSYVSMGVYVLEPVVLRFIPEHGPYDFPMLVQTLLDVGARVGAYPYDGTWFDIGRSDDYAEAAAVWGNGVPSHSRA